MTDHLYLFIIVPDAGVWTSMDQACSNDNPRSREFCRRREAQPRQESYRRTVMETHCRAQTFQYTETTRIQLTLTHSALFGFTSGLRGATIVTLVHNSRRRRAIGVDDGIRRPFAAISAHSALFKTRHHALQQYMRPEYAADSALNNESKVL